MNDQTRDPRLTSGRPHGPRLLALVAWSVSIWACSDVSTGPGDAVDPLADAPRTGFEQRDGSGFTTHQEEVAFLGEVEAASARVRSSTIGTSVEGRPIHLVRVAHPAPAPDEQIATGRSVLVIGGQHGNEPAGREMALQLLRDLAFTEDGPTIGTLGEATVLFIPTANPDGRVADTRGNANGLDINRDHLHLESPEARAISLVLRDLDPDLVVDAHERPGGTTPDMELLWPRNLNVFEPVRDLSRALVLDRLVGDLDRRGRTVELYGAGPGPPGDENEHILRNAAGLRHHLALLTESAGTRPARERVAVQLEALQSVLAFHRARASEIAAARAAAPDEKTDAGRERSEPFYLGGADDDPPSPDQVLDPPPCAYLLTAAQLQSLETQITLLPLRIEGSGGPGARLPMDQPLVTLIPLLADDRARGERVDATPVASDEACAALR